jgi:hypothetical protein
LLSLSIANRIEKRSFTMSISTCFAGTFSHSQARRAKRPNPLTTSSHRRHTYRPSLEGLEIRLTLSLTTLASFGAFPTVANAVGTTDTGYTGTADFTSIDRTANLTANDMATEMGADPFGGVVPQKPRPVR